MGNVNKLSSQTTPLDYYLHDLNHQIVKDQLLGNGRFLKTIKCQHSSYDEGALVVKIYVKDGNTSLKEQEQQLNGWSSINMESLFIVLTRILWEPSTP